jgi:hypothetical protein
MSEKGQPVGIGFARRSRKRLCPIAPEDHSALEDRRCRWAVLRQLAALGFDKVAKIAAGGSKSRSSCDRSGIALALDLILYLPSGNTANELRQGDGVAGAFESLAGLHNSGLAPIDVFPSLRRFPVG